MIDLLNLWLHLVSLAVYFGGGVVMVAVFLPAVRAVLPPSEQQRCLARGLRVYNPLSIGALGVALMSGAFNLTSYKAALGAQFFPRIGWVLALKLLLVFVLINLSAAATLGTGHRLVRMHQSGETLEPERLASMVRRMQVLTAVALILTGATVLVALEMTYLARIP